MRQDKRFSAHHMHFILLLQWCCNISLVPPVYKCQQPQRGWVVWSRQTQSLSQNLDLSDSAVGLCLFFMIEGLWGRQKTIHSFISHLSSVHSDEDLTMSTRWSHPLIPSPGDLVWGQGIAFTRSDSGGGARADLLPKRTTLHFSLFKKK